MAEERPPGSNAASGARPQAGAAGVGSGTLLVLLAQNLPDSNPAKSWLLILSPSATVAIAYLWARMRVAIDDYFAQRSVRLLFLQAQKTLQGALDDPNATDEHKALIRSELEQIQRDYIGSATSRFRARLKDHGEPRQ